MKTIKETKSKTGKKLIVDITNIESYDDVKMAFIIAKVNQGHVITPVDLENVVDYVTKISIEEYEKNAADIVSAVKELLEYEKPKKKENIFRRFWRWLTGK